MSDRQPIFEAILFAAQAHSGQFRKASKIPYITHPLSVGNLLIRYGCPDPLVVAGILHDTVEDTPVTLAEIEQTFGPQVAELVAGASEPDKSAPWEQRKQHTIDYLRTASMDVLLVVCADKIDNVRSTRVEYAEQGEAVWTYFSRPRDKQAWYYRSLAEVLLNRSSSEPGATMFRHLADEVAQLYG